MRIISGRFKGRQLKRPKGRDIRPTSDRVRKSMFDLLGPMDGRRVLDLFAGTGALGLEALSRGAASVVFVERSREARTLIERNAAMVEAGEDARIWRLDAARAAARAAGEGMKFDLVLCDPPYDIEDADAILSQPGWKDVLSEQPLLVWECSSRREPAVDCANWELSDRRRYGETVLLLLTFKRDSKRKSIS